MDRSERNRLLKRLSGLFVETSKTREAFAALTDLHETGVGLEGSCLLLFGPRGTGKSIVIKRYVARFPRRTSADGLKDIVPVLRVEVPPGCTLKSLAASILEALGAALPTRGATQVELTGRVMHHLREQEVELLILHEFQHLINKETDRIAYDAADWVKGLLNAAICGIVLVGQMSSERVVETNPQLERRTAGAVYMTPYDWRSPEERTEYRAFLARTEKALNLPGRSDLASFETALRIHHYSRGLLGHTMPLIREAYKLALDDERPAITYDLLARAVDALRVGSKRRLVNPFRLATIEPADPAPMQDDVDARRADAESQHRKAMSRVGRGEG